MASREQLQGSALAFADPIAETLEKIYGHKRVGFAMFLFEFGSTGNLVYISNADRGDIAKAMRELLDHWEVGLDSDPLGPRAKG